MKILQKRIVRKLPQIFQLLLVIVGPLANCSISYAWNGIVVEKGTDKSIENAVIVRDWTKAFATPAGASHSRVDLKEILSDASGKFFSMATTIPIVTPYFAIYEESPVVFKAGYKYLVLQKHQNVIELEPVPTIIDDRKEELHKVYIPGYSETPVLDDIIEKEREFIKAYEEIGNFFKNPMIKIDYMDKSLPQNVEVPVQGQIMTGSAIGGFGASNALSPPPPRTYKKNPDIEKIISILENKNSKDQEIIDAIEKSNRIPDPAVIPHLQKFFLHNSSSVRSQALGALYWYDTQVLIEYLNDILSAFHDPDKNIRIKATNYLIRIGKPAVEPLIDELRSGDDQSQLQAVYALGQIQDERGFEPLAQKALDKNFRAEVAEAIGNFKSKRSIRKLIEILSTFEKNDEKFKRVIAALVRIGKPGISLIQENFSTYNTTLRTSLIYVLEGRGDDESISFIIKLLDDDSEEIRLAAENSISRKMGPDFIPQRKDPNHFFHMLKDKDTKKREAAVHKLLSVGEPSFEVLVKGSKNSDSYIRWKSLRYLMQHRKEFPEWVLDNIVSCLDDSAAEVRIMAISAVGFIAYKKCSDYLKSYVTDKDPGISSHAKFVMDWAEKSIWVPPKN